MAKVAVLGYGVVGSGAAEVLDMNAKSIAKKVGEDVTLKYIVDIRQFPDSPYASCFVSDFSVVEQDSEVSVVVETIGGKGVAYEFTRRALAAGKSVVTSNKELVATHGCELIELARANGANYFFEASVGGGIPIIRPLVQCLGGNQVEEICGILNGTTNYILTRMIKGGLAFDVALKEAQANGYAEQDPTADIEGHDACRKICILSNLAYGRNVSPELVPTQGITGVTLSDVAYAEACGKKIKLLGRSMPLADDKVCAYVAPHLVDGEHSLAGVEDVFNAVAVKGNAVNEVMFYGPGAGKLPTASAVVADVMEAVKHGTRPNGMEWVRCEEDFVVSPEVLVNQWYVRGTGTPEQVKSALGEVTFLARSGAPSEEVAFLTAAMTSKELEEKLAGFAVASSFRVLG